ncbi:MAG: bifunctional DNA-binding transcriptional regulator/O6-methylguanine-DNA methyltransferase Ada [Gemmatimonadetes bacterium]|nr:MAG: bifunctional DNA-binding transcriptional regulator/O6-methylguanine-DNA methyltransferase Ada [Gemmatimonadota bacterium]
MSPAAVASELSAARRWRIVLAHDRRYDGAFVYAVRSTGIYCRPSCASRRPRRAQVTFFSIPEAAEQAGFRACRRCRPGQAPAPDPQVGLVREVCRQLDAPSDAPARLVALSRRVGTTPHQLVRAFRRILGVTPRQYQDARRLSRFTAHLKERKRVSPATYAAGYSSSSRVYERAAAQLGMTPATYARGGRGMVIAFAAVPCPLGTLLVAATPRGICRVSLGHGAPELEAELRGEFPGAEIQRDRGDLGRWVAAILRYLDGREPHLDLPLDIRATAFQRQVWEALRKIPYGRTRSYAEVARAIGRPRATRAVARACASNPAALVIPCHRVVKSNGDLGGYRWGMERKQALLRQESGNRPGNN